MEVIVAKSAGFCFGVQNAINKALEAAKSGKNVYTYGPIIHNTGVVEELEIKGIKVLNNIDDIKNGNVVIIRSHGISKSEYDVLSSKGADIIDATCINVKNIHKIVEEKLKEGYKIIIIGDPQHPEVKGVNGWCNNEALIINAESDLLNIQRDNNKICVVAQTTYNQEKWYQMSCKLLQCAKETLIFNTICEATKLRQSEVLELSKNVDAMLVIGGEDSSNTKKLYEIAKENCELTIFIQSADELDLELINGKEKVGVTGGASTPQNIISEIVNKINSLSIKELKVETKNDDKLEDMNNECFYNDFIEVYPGCVLDGEVILVNDKELFLDIKYKSEALLTIQEDYNESMSLKEKYKLGDIVSVEVIKTNDGEGNVLVSRKNLQRQEYLQKFDRMFNEKEAIDVVVDELNKGGYSCHYENMRAFMPLSLSGLYRNDDNNSLVGKKLTVLINEIKKKKDEVELIVSRKEIVQEEKDKNVKEQLQNTEEGQILSGKVKAIINTGVFVNVDNIDIFVPISEIVWRRINSPRDVINEESNVDVLIVKVDRENQKVLGSIKRSGIEPWDKFIVNYKEENIIDGTVVRFTEYGAFVELIDGVDGLLHISNMSESRINKPQDVLKIGQKIKAKIIKIDSQLKRVALSLKDIE